MIKLAEGIQTWRMFWAGAGIPEFWQPIEMLFHELGLGIASNLSVDAVAQP
jgi:hypothetical protein